MPYDRITVSPHWEWWLIIYFFLGGIAGGSFFIAGLVGLVGKNEDRALVKPAFYLGLPLVLICTVCLILDLGRPERFWHMVLQSNTFLPMFKYWSPMSYGSWILSVFGALTAVAFAGVLAEDNRFGLGRFRLLAWVSRLWRTGITGALFNVLAMLFGYGLAAYTGALLTATNQPFWSDSAWLGALFFVSAVSAGTATLILIGRRATAHESLGRLEVVDGVAIGLELLMLIAFLVSLGALAGTFIGSFYGILLLIFTVVLGLLVPLGLQFAPRLLGGRGPLIAAVLVLIGGFVLRYSVLMAAQHIEVAGR